MAHRRHAPAMDTPHRRREEGATPAAAAVTAAAAAAGAAPAGAAAPAPSLRHMADQRTHAHPPQPPSSAPRPSPPLPPAAARPEMQPAQHAPPLPSSPHSHMILAGLASGVSVAGLFNPWDRALYLSVLHSRPFLNRANFSRPYQGFWQVLFHRTLTGGLYFPLFDMAQPLCRDLITSWVALPHGGGANTTEAEQSALLHFACGNFAGGVSGIVLNSLTAIKYASWNGKTGFFTTARSMWAAGGIRPFTKGISATVIRDTVFGGCFALTKFKMVQALQPHIEPEPLLDTHRPISRTTQAVLHARLASSDSTHLHHGTPTLALAPQDKLASHANTVHAHVPAAHPSSAPPPRFQLSAGTADFSAALMAGLAATCVSAPFNYVRNIKYGWSAKSVPPHSWTILLDLARETRTVARPAKHVQERLRLGWGTARVAVGMAVGQYLYEFTKVQLDQAHEQKHAAEAAAAAPKVKF